MAYSSERVARAIDILDRLTRIIQLHQGFVQAGRWNLAWEVPIQIDSLLSEWRDLNGAVTDPPSVTLDTLFERPRAIKELNDLAQDDLRSRAKVVNALLGLKTKPERAAARAAPKPEDPLDFAGALKFLNCAEHWLKHNQATVGGLKQGQRWVFPVFKLREYLAQTK
jgi:hypothetical protein